MHLEHLHSRQGGQGGSGLMHAVVLITAATEAADHNNVHGAQLRVATITCCRGAYRPRGSWPRGPGAAALASGLVQMNCYRSNVMAMAWITQVSGVDDGELMHGWDPEGCDR